MAKAKGKKAAEKRVPADKKVVGEKKARTRKLDGAMAAELVSGTKQEQKVSPQELTLLRTQVEVAKDNLGKAQAEATALAEKARTLVREATDAWFEWGTGATLPRFISTPSQALGAGATSVQVNDNLVGLTTGQTYHFRIAANNSLGTVNGNIASLTPGTAPSLTTQSATSVLDISATLNGSISPNGLTTTAWFDYGTDSSLTVHDNTAPQILPGVTGSFPLNAPISGLTISTTYYFRVVGQNSAGSQFGLIEHFTTLAKVSLWDQMIWDQDNWH